MPGTGFYSLQQQPFSTRDNGNNFCQILVLGYPKRYNFVPSGTQKKRPETSVIYCRICKERLETKLLLVESVY